MISYEKALDDYISATNTHDFNNVERLLADGGIYWFSDKTCVTKEEIKDCFENAWDTIRDEIYRATDVQWVSVDGHSAVCLYTYR